MNPAAWYHTVSVKRTDARTKTSSTVFASVRCKIEPIATANKPFILGELPQAKAHITWGIEDIHETDTVIWNSQEYTIRSIIDDTSRPLHRSHTGILTGRHA